MTRNLWISVSSTQRTSILYDGIGFRGETLEDHRKTDFTEFLEIKMLEGCYTVFYTLFDDLANWVKFVWRRSGSSELPKPADAVSGD